MNGIPAEVGESLISHNVTVSGSSPDIGVLDPATGCWLYDRTCEWKARRARKHE